MLARVVALGMTKSINTDLRARVARRRRISFLKKAAISTSLGLVLGTAALFATGALPTAPQAGNGAADVSSCAQYHSIPNPCDPDSNN